MPKPPRYKKVEPVRARRGNYRASSNSVIYNILDALEKTARIVATVNRWVMGDPRTASGKRRLRRIKKYAKIDKRTGMLILKKEKKLTGLKYSKPAKRWTPRKKWLVL